MLRLLAVLVLCLSSAAAHAQPFPSKPVRLIVTYGPGGSSDLMSRVFGQKLGEIWGQQIIIESKPGAAGSIGMEYTARQPADGYTFVVGNIQPAAVNPLLSKVPYNMEKDFIPVSLISTGPNVLVVNAAWEAKSLGEILAYARANPGKLSYGTSGPGSISHLAAELLKNLTKANMVEIPYKGSALTIQDLLGQQIQFIFSDALPAMQHIRSGKLRALCTTGAEKFALLPELPTCDASVPGLVAVNWWGVLLPAGTPRPIVDKYQADMVKVMQDATVKGKFADLGVEAVSSTQEQFASFMKAESDKYARLIKEAGIKVNP
jgi:tripartite-type tricarboxylate transporter receptor subunit TctC